MKHVFIVNPAAGHCDRTEQIKTAVKAVFGAAGEEYEIKVSQAPGDCMALARAAAEQGGEVRLYACGGDGTLNEVVNGVVGYDNVSVTHFPAGSGNDFIKIFDEPAAFRDLQRLLDSEEACFDLISCHDGERVCYAINICSVGLDARISAGMSTFRRLPMVGGKGAYLLSTAFNVLKGIHRPFEVELAGQTIRGEQTLICVCNGRNYGGSFNPVPDAEPDDGLLDVLVIKGVSRLKAAAVIGRYQKGGYAELPDLIRHFRTDKVRISSGGGAVNVDGETIEAAEILFAVEPGRIRFFYPRGLQYRSKASKEALAGAI